MTDRLALPLRYRKQLKALLDEHVPGVEVWAYGSRVNGESHEGSDLDLALRGPALEPLDGGFYDLLEAIEKSNIPILIQAHDWARLPESFHREIKRDHVVVQEGAKQTTAGEWRRVPFQEVVYFQEGPGIRHWQYRDKGVPFVNIRCLVDGRLDVSSMNRLDPVEVNEKYQHFLLDAGDYVVSSSGTIGRIAEVSEDALPCMLNTSVIRMRSKDESSLNRRYLRYFLTSSLFQEQIHAFAAGSVQVNYGPTHLNQMWMALPPMPQQRASAHVLGTLDDKIELNRRMNETLEEMARALFKSWFVDFEPVRAKMEGRWRRGETRPTLPADLYDMFPDRLVDSELGEVPDGWEVRALGAMVEQLRDNENPQASPTATFSHFSIPAHDEGQMPKRELGESIKSVKTRVPPNVVLLSKLNPEIERVWLVDVVHGERAICSTEFLVLRPHPPFQRSYVYCLARAPLFRQQMESLVTGTSKSHQRAPANAILSLRAVIPPARVIEKFELSASELLNRGAILRKESHALAAQRDALLPGLVSGRTQSSTGTRM